MTTARSQELSKALDRGVENLDITPTMFGEVTTHYGAIADKLRSYGLEADIKPYGSFGTGTVVRPLKSPKGDGPGSYYDLDVLAECRRDGIGWMTPRALRSEVDGILRGDSTYAQMIEDPSSQCLTIAYAESDGRSAFKLDLSSGVSAPRPDAGISFGSESVRLAWIDPNEWKGSNPVGLCDWFNAQNERFLLYGRTERRKAILDRYKRLYSSVEQIPDQADRSALQRAVQVVKRSRDIYFSLASSEDDAPSSCVLMVLVAQAAEILPSDADIVTIVEAFASACASMSDAVPVVLNPVYPENLVEGWSEQRIATFHHWAGNLSENLAVDMNDKARRNAAIDGLLGGGTSSRLEREGLLTAAPPSITIGRPVKPWRG